LSFFLDTLHPFDRQSLRELAASAVRSRRSRFD